MIKTALCSKLLLTLLAFKVLLCTVREHVRTKDGDMGNFFFPHSWHSIFAGPV